MRKLALVLGGLLVVLAAVLLVRDAGQALGALWASINADSLVGFGAVIEKKVDPDLWSGVFVPVLSWPAWILPALVGALLVLAARPWRRRKARG